jgi:hypothetical protein
MKLIRAAAVLQSGILWGAAPGSSIHHFAVLGRYNNRAVTAIKMNR